MGGQKTEEKRDCVDGALLLLSMSEGKSYVGQA